MKNFREAENGDLAIVTPVRRCSNSCFSIAYGYEFFYHIPLALGIATGCPCLIFVVASLPHMSIVHRDVKPDNVIIRGTEAVLIDFDASRIYKNENREDTQILGTTGFAAPEQYGLSQSDGRADIYALGVLLNIMLTGEHPSRKLASGRMGRIVQRCTMVNPEKRYKNILHLMEVL